MKIPWPLLAVVAQVALLAFMAGQREWVVRTGEPLVLRTAPRDPNDPMRGRYVHLDFEMNRVPKDKCEGGIPRWFAEDVVYRKLRDRQVYARLKVNSDGLAELEGLTDQKPESGLFIRGRTEFVNTDSIRVRYGVEALFLQEDRARRIDTEVMGEKRGLPLNVHVAVSKSGLAVMKGYEWEPLGITLRLHRETRDTRPAGGNQRREIVTGVTVVLKNFGTKPIAIVVRPAGRSFRLVPVALWGPLNVRWVGQNQPLPKPTGADVRVLQPGESYEERIALEGAEWWVVSREPSTGGERPPMSLTELWLAGTGANFRMEYSPPRDEEVRGLPQADLIWQRSLPSPAFAAQGGID